MVGKGLDRPARLKRERLLFSGLKNAAVWWISKSLVGQPHELALAAVDFEGIQTLAPGVVARLVV
jgi:hypothetical protein